MFVYIFVFILTVFFTNHRLKIFSAKISPLSVALLLYIFIQVVPGVILVSVFDFPMSYGLHDAISDEIKTFTLNFTIASLIILFWLLYFTSFLVNLNIDFCKYNTSFTTALFLFLVSIFLMTVKLVSVSNIPLITALLGNPALAAYQKAEVLRGESGIGGFMIGYLFEYFHLITLAYLFLSKKERKVNLLFYVFIIICAFYSFYNLEKIKFIYLFIYLIVLNTMVNGFEFKKIFPLLTVGLVLLVLSFIVLGQAGYGDVVSSILNRAIIGQMEGSYMIYEALKPDINRVYYGLPLSFIFGSNVVTDPAADVVRIFFPTAGDAWVNSNSYVLAHAWSIFGFFAVIIMPLMVTLNIIAFAILRDLFKKYIGVIAALIYFTLIMALKINNDFSFFLYLKSTISFLTLAVFSSAVVGLKNSILTSFNSTYEYKK